jgi:hypothetical protein
MSDAEYEQIGWTLVGAYGRVFHDMGEQILYRLHAEPEEKHDLEKFVPVYVKRAPALPEDTA